MISIYIREQRRYLQSELRELLKCSEDEVVHIIKKLKEYGILKVVNLNERQRNLTELLDDDIEIADVKLGDNKYLYVFTFVGIITIENRIIKCCPKYLSEDNELDIKLKQILKVLEKYNSREQIISLYNDTDDGSSFNVLAIILFFLRDYYENGVYTNVENIVEINGTGDILWEKTISDSFALLKNNRPYYPEMYTKRRRNDDYDYFKRLHEVILTKCSKELSEDRIDELFDIVGVDLSDEDFEDLGGDEFILDQIEKELNVQYITRKQLILKAMYAYILNRDSHLSDMDGFSMFGCNNFNIIWEKACVESFNDMRGTLLGGLPLKLNEKYENLRNKDLKTVIEKPIWYGKKDNSFLPAVADDTLEPDLITIFNEGNEALFIIFDAKYYNLQLSSNKVKGQPGIESITKQYLYQLAYREFVQAHNFTKVINCFLLPTEKDKVVDAGYVELSILKNLELENILVRLVPAQKVFSCYLSGTDMDILDLKL